MLFCRKRKKREIIKLILQKKIFLRNKELIIGFSRGLDGQNLSIQSDYSGKKEILIENICIELPRFTEKAKVASHSATANKQVSVNW